MAAECWGEGFECWYFSCLCIFHCSASLYISQKQMSWRGAGCPEPSCEELPSSLVSTGSGWMGGSSLGCLAVGAVCANSYCGFYSLCVSFRWCECILYSAPSFTPDRVQSGARNGFSTNSVHLDSITHPRLIKIGSVMLEHGAAHARYLQGVQKPCAGFICSLSVGGTGSFRKSERTVFAGGSCTNKQEDVILCIL